MTSFPKGCHWSGWRAANKGIHDVRQAVCTTKIHALCEDVDDMEPGLVPSNRQYQFWKVHHHQFPFWRFLIARKLD
jgi:hypothetical protein